MAGRIVFQESVNIAEPVIRLPVFPPVNRDVGTPLEHWRERADLAPKDASARVDRMIALRQLLDGLSSPLRLSLKKFAVPAYFNWFEDAADSYRDLLSTTAPVGFPIAAVVDYLAYGVAIIDGEQLIKPEDFYPVGLEADDGWTFLRFYQQAKRVEVHQSTGRVRTFELNGRQLGALIDDDERPTELVVVTAEPRRTTSLWGDSMFERMADTVARLTLIDAAIDSGIYIHHSPVLYLKEAGASFTRGQMKPLTDALNEEFESNRRVGQFQMLGPDEELGYVVAQFDNRPVEEQRKSLVKRLNNITGIAPTLMGDEENRLGVLSGTAISQTFIRTAARCNEIIRAFSPYIAGEWQNPIERLTMDAEAAAQTKPPEQPREGVRQ